MSHLIANLPKVMSEVVKKGKVYEVGQHHAPGIPHHPNHPPFLYSLGRMHNDLPYGEGTTAANDFIATGTHTGTHMDAIGHIACNGYIYGDIFADEHQEKTSGLKSHSIDTATPVFRRGVMLDVATYMDVPHLEAGYGIGAEDLKGTIKKQGVSIQEGDAVLIRTGWAKFFNQPRKYVSVVEGVPGVNMEGARWLLDQGMGLAGGDTVAFEIQPAHTLPVHCLLLVENGIHIIELMNLEDPAKDKVYEFLFVCLPLRITGGTGSPVRPVAVI
ncbi:putative cyclase [Neobacillus bataviensis LMG 21833]|uniref:Putative cyclase n=1 Tax=Neobacillus bataviensis LMG 21833 TaxID=1117379 RepID=K6DF75_9BACI|nr:cyclase family protein [Neobacillus bataviensis]EKN66959.1 putative cyclase [Neobacillus bataviensis LMG 21833]